MFQHLLNLLSRSIVAFPTIISGNWLSILLPLVFFLLKDGWPMLQRRRQGLPMLSAKEKRDSLLLAGIYLLLFMWAVARSIYADHQYLADKARTFHSIVDINAKNYQENLGKQKDEFSQFQIECAKKDGVAETLQTQNRDQQNTINNCQTEALKLLTPVDQKTTSLIFDNSVDSNGNATVSRFVLLTNKPVSPVQIKVQCDHYLDSVSLGPIGSPSGAMGESSRIAGNTFVTEKVTTPPWTPTQPYVLNVKYLGPGTMKCGVDLR
jgi:hypothetical protein